MMSTWHIIDGAEGCAFAARHGLAVIVVDALRASATAAMLLHHGATQITVVGSVDHARALREQDPEALLFGERGGIPPEGFDGGNSPRETAHAAGRRVIFTTTNGAQRLVEASGAPLVCFGTTTNARAVAQFALSHPAGAVLVPAGLAGAPPGAATEDRAAAAYIAHIAGIALGEGADIARAFADHLTHDGLQEVFAAAPHAAAMREIGLDEDIAWCASIDQCSAVPRVLRYEHDGDITRAILDNATGAR